MADYPDCNELCDYPDNYEDYIDAYKFKDDKMVYTNGIELIPVYRVKQMLVHYFDDLTAKPKPEVTVFDWNQLDDASITIQPFNPNDWHIEYVDHTTAMNGFVRTTAAGTADIDRTTVTGYWNG